MVVDTALESTGAKFHHVPTPDLPHLMLVEPMAWYALVAEGTVENHLCACRNPSLEVKHCLDAVVIVAFF